MVNIGVTGLALHSLVDQPVKKRSAVIAECRGWVCLYFPFMLLTRILKKRWWKRKICYAIHQYPLLYRLPDRRNWQTRDIFCGQLECTLQIVKLDLSLLLNQHQVPWHWNPCLVIPHKKSLQCEQNVGCLKNLAMNLCDLITFKLKFGVFFS